MTQPPPSTQPPMQWGPPSAFTKALLHDIYGQDAHFDHEEVLA